MTTPAGPTGYPASWRPAGAPPPEPDSAQEALMIAVDAYIASLSPQEFDQMVQRCRGGQ